MRLIDADKLKDAFEEDGHLSGYIEEYIDEQPTLTPDDVWGVGEWKQKEIINLEDTTIEQMQSACCSVCGKYHTTPFSYYFTEYNYCPSCGARMTRAEAEKAMEVSG